MSSYLNTIMMTFAVSVMDCGSTMQEFLDREKGNNVEKEKMLQTTERQVAKCRLQLQSDESSNTQLKDELETLKFTVEREATDLDKAKSERKQLGRDMEDKKVK